MAGGWALPTFLLPTPAVLLCCCCGASPDTRLPHVPVVDNPLPHPLRPLP